MRYRFLAVAACCTALAGCGTTKWTDTRRSATEQLLISDAMDRAVGQLDLRPLAGQTVYLDDRALKKATDSEYLISSLREHLLACGCILKDNQTEADFIVEGRAGAVGTDRHELIYGIPAVKIPTLIPVAGFGIPSQIPEVPFVTKTDQQAVAKIAVFAYSRETGRAAWHSGIVAAQSDAKAIWIFGAGPLQRGDIYEGTQFAGKKLDLPLIELADRRDSVVPSRPLAQTSDPLGQATASDQPAAGENDDSPGSSEQVTRTAQTPPAPLAAVGTPSGSTPADGAAAPSPPPTGPPSTPVPPDS